MYPKDEGTPLKLSAMMREIRRLQRALEVIARTKGDAREIARAALAVSVIPSA